MGTGAGTALTSQAGPVPQGRPGCTLPSGYRRSLCVRDVWSHKGQRARAGGRRAPSTGESPRPGPRGSGWTPSALPLKGSSDVGDGKASESPSRVGWGPDGTCRVPESPVRESRSPRPAQTSMSACAGATLDCRAGVRSRDSRDAISGVAVWSLLSHAGRVVFLCVQGSGGWFAPARPTAIGARVAPGLGGTHAPRRLDREARRGRRGLPAWKWPRARPQVVPDPVRTRRLLRAGHAPEEATEQGPPFPSCPQGRWNRGAAAAKGSATSSGTPGRQPPLPPPPPGAGDPEPGSAALLKRLGSPCPR